MHFSHDMSLTTGMEDYHFIKKIGEGSFGRVFLARRKYTGSMVAIKMINKADQDRDDLISFRREVDILKKVDHPNIMKMLDMVESDTDFCVISELAHGDLFQIIDDNQTLPESVLKIVAAQLVSALQDLHRQRIIHRDIKPQNVLIASNGSLKLCDFGFARALSYKTLTLTSIKGTPLYMAPELVQERPYNEKIDIWSLGIILYELFYGKPPFFTSSIYKLIQMIIHDPITWPGPISDNFKDFLLVMLQKDPDHRADCDYLLTHPFISDVNLGTFSDEMYKFKREQFTEALADPLSATFQQPKDSEKDINDIFMNPGNHSEKDLVFGMKELQKRPLDDTLVSSFVFHFKEFIKSPAVAREAVQEATALLKDDPEKYLGQMFPGVALLKDPEFSKYYVEFFTELLVKPFANARINMEQDLPEIVMDDEIASRLRDRLLQCIFGENQDEVTRVYVFIAYLVETIPSFRACVSGAFTVQMMPVLTAAFINQNELIRAAVLTIMTEIFKLNSNAFQYIQPFDSFLDVLFAILKKVPNDTETVACFSAALTFSSTAFVSLLVNLEFRKRIPNQRKNIVRFPEFISSAVLIEQIMKPLLRVSARMPQSEQAILSYICITKSPFELIPLDDILLDSCVEELPYLLRCHIVPLLNAALSLSPEDVNPHINKLLRLFRMGDCADIICQYILRTTSETHEDVSDIVDCESGIIPALCNVINDLGGNTPTSVMLLLTHIVMNYRTPSGALKKHCDDIADALIRDAVTETGLIILAHCARLSADFANSIVERGVLGYAQTGLYSQYPCIRAKACSLIGNLAKHTTLPGEFVEGVMPDLINQMKSPDSSCQKFALYALGNIIHQSSEMTVFLSPELSTVCSLLRSHDRKTIEYAAYLTANFIRRNETCTNLAIKEGLLEEIVDYINDADKAALVIQPLSVFCIFEDGRKAVRAKNIIHALQMLTKSRIDTVQTTATSIIHCLE